MRVCVKDLLAVHPPPHNLRLVSCVQVWVVYVLRGLHVCVEVLLATYPQPHNLRLLRLRVFACLGVVVERERRCGFEYGCGIECECECEVSAGNCVGVEVNVGVDVGDREGVEVNVGVGLVWVSVRVWVWCGCGQMNYSYQLRRFAHAELSIQQKLVSTHFPPMLAARLYN